MGELAALGSAAVFGGADFLGGLASRKSQAIAVTFVTGLGCRRSRCCSSSCRASSAAARLPGAQARAFSATLA